MWFLKTRELLTTSFLDFSLLLCFEEVFSDGFLNRFLAFIDCEAFHSLIFDFYFRFICLTATQCFIHALMFYLRLPSTYSYVKKGHLAEVIWFFNITKTSFLGISKCSLMHTVLCFHEYFSHFFLRSKGDLMDHLRLIE